MVDITATINPNSGTTARISSPTSTGPQKVSVTIPSSGPLVQNGALKLRLLQDVDASVLEDGAMLQYSANHDKFVTRTEIITTTGNLTMNGGEY